MKERLPLPLLLFSLMALTAIAEDAGRLQLVESRRIWDKAAHNTFPKNVCPILFTISAAIGDGNGLKPRLGSRRPLLRLGLLLTLPRLSLGLRFTPITRTLGVLMSLCALASSSDIALLEWSALGHIPRVSLLRRPPWDYSMRRPISLMKCSLISTFISTTTRTVS